MPSGWDLSLSPHALLISLTPAGEALARRGAGGEPGDLGSLCLSTCPASAPSGSWGRRPGLPSAAFGPRVWCPPPPGKMPAGGGRWLGRACETSSEWGAVRAEDGVGGTGVKLVSCGMKKKAAGPGLRGPPVDLRFSNRVSHSALIRRGPMRARQWLPWPEPQELGSEIKIYGCP